MKRVVLLFVAGLVLFVGTVIFVVSTNREATKESCRAHHSTVEVLRLFLSEGAKQFEARPVTPENAAELKEFKETTHQLLNSIDCDPSRL